MGLILLRFQFLKIKQDRVFGLIVFADTSKIKPMFLADMGKFWVNFGLQTDGLYYLNLEFEQFGWYFLVPDLRFLYFIRLNKMKFCFYSKISSLSLVKCVLFIILSQFILLSTLLLAIYLFVRSQHFLTWVSQSVFKKSLTIKKIQLFKFA